jgi:SAM-dependent methyltransferase
MANNESKCRFCGKPLKYTFIDLGMQPLCESFVKGEQLNQMEPFYPLHTYVCHNCFLVQLEEYVAPENIFSEYAYFSSYSNSWLKHAENYVDMITDKLELNKNSLVIEVASNDGYLLQYFVQKGIPVFGIEPASNVADAAINKGIDTLVKFLNIDSARVLLQKGLTADLLIGNNVLAHVPDLNGFVESLKLILKPSGVLTMEFPHLMQLVDGNQFDTIYHEHFSYFSFLTVEKIFKAHDLIIFDVEELSTHGGSLRIYVRHNEYNAKPIGPRVNILKEREIAAGYTDLAKYFTFDEKVRETKRSLLELLIKLKRDNKSIVGYGAPGKGNTLLNYCGIRNDFLEYTVDRNPYKHGKFLPGTHIPVLNPDQISISKPEYILILPWNIKNEIFNQLRFIEAWDGKFIVPIPEVGVYDAKANLQKI